MGRFDDPCTAMQQLVESRLKCKTVQQCSLGSTLLASFEYGSLVCRLSIAANTKSKAMMRFFCRAQGPCQHRASSTTRVSRMTAKWSSEAMHYVTGSSRCCMMQHGPGRERQASSIMFATVHHPLQQFVSHDDAKTRGSTLTVMIQKHR